MRAHRTKPLSAPPARGRALACSRAAAARRPDRVKPCRRAYFAKLPPSCTLSTLFVPGSGSAICVSDSYSPT
eukprot:7376257-Prymnesium_polylepis.1